MSQGVTVGATQYERMWARSSRIKSILALTHPTAVLVFGIATLVLACIAARGIPDAATLIDLIFAMASAQCAIGIWNEVFDRDLDRVAKPWRAIPAGYISASAASVIGLVAILLALFLASRLSALSTVLLGLGMGMGILYSAALKRSALSWVVHVTTYPALPIWVWASLDRFDNRLLAVYPVAIPLALAFHFVNQLCDFDEDSAMGMKGLVQHLGKETSVRLCRYLLVISPLPLLVWGMSMPGNLASWIVIITAAMIWWKLVIPVLPQHGPGSSGETFRIIFDRLKFAAPLLLFAWVLAGQV